MRKENLAFFRYNEFAINQENLNAFKIQSSSKKTIQSLSDKKF